MKSIQKSYLSERNIAEGVCLTGDGVNINVIGLGAFPLPAERYNLAQ